MITIYTLKTCDTCKKALKWLDNNNVEYANHDVRTDGLSRSDIELIVTSIGWETAVNRRSTTWRGLDEAEKTDIDNEKAINLIERNPTLMKRPVFLAEGFALAGFDTAAQQKLGEITS